MHQPKNGNSVAVFGEDHWGVSGSCAYCTHDITHHKLLTNTGFIRCNICHTHPNPSAPEDTGTEREGIIPDRTPRQSIEDIPTDRQPLTLTKAQLIEGIRLLEADHPPKQFCLIHHTSDLSLCSGRCVVVTFGTQKEYRAIPCQQPATAHHGQHFDLMDPKCAGYFTCRITRGLKHASACPLSEEP